jgi:hypothetical protein
LNNRVLRDEGRQFLRGRFKGEHQQDEFKAASQEILRMELQKHVNAFKQAPVDRRANSEFGKIWDYEKLAETAALLLRWLMNEERRVMLKHVEGNIE